MRGLSHGREEGDAVPRTKGKEGRSDVLFFWSDLSAKKKSEGGT